MAKLPYSSIYYHMLHLHGVAKPADPDVILVGFDLSSTPTAVFRNKSKIFQQDHSGDSCNTSGISSKDNSNEHIEGTISQNSFI